ncbi:MAG: rod shape-determining protein MreC [Gemmatimonadota bacterium]
MAYAPEPERRGARHQNALAIGFALLAVATLYLNVDTQQRIAQVFQSSALRPFIWTQETLVQARVRAEQIDVLQDEVDSLTAVLATQAAVSEENRSLRDLLGLAERAGPSFLQATVIRPGTPGSESMFFVDVGRRDGVRPYAPVVSARGLVGVIREVRERDAIAMDWTNPEFRASAMLQDGSAYGMVENVRGEFREEDRLILNGTAYHETLRKGAMVLTSGLGAIPRGIPIGHIDETAEVQGSWRKSYWLRPSAEPGSVTHVLVAVTSAPEDVGDFWPADSLKTGPREGAAADEPGADPSPER